MEQFIEEKGLPRIDAKTVYGMLPTNEVAIEDD